jgi:hypothetical protein
VQRVIIQGSNCYGGAGLQELLGDRFSNALGAAGDEQRSFLEAWGQYIDLTEHRGSEIGRMRPL